MKWADFAPYVLPHVMGCPIPVLEHHARQAAIMFCRKTLCHRIDVDSVTLAGSIADVSAPVGLRIVKIKSLTVDGREWNLFDASRGMKLERQDAPGEYAYSKDNRTLFIHPAPDAGAEIVVDAAVCPSEDSTDLDDRIADSYAGQIGHGIVARIALLPRQEFSDTNVALAHAGLFKSAMDTTAMQVARGWVNQKMPSFVDYK